MINGKNEIINKSNNNVTATKKGHRRGHRAAIGYVTTDIASFGYGQHTYTC